MSKKAIPGSMKSQKSAAKKFAAGSKKTLDKSSSADVSSAASPAATEAATETPSSTTMAPSQEHSHMAGISLTRNDKQRKSNAVTYTAQGYAGSVRFSKSFFADKTGPTNLSLSDDSFAGPRVPRAQLTKEQRAELRKNAPKLTPQEKLAKIEERAAKLRAKIASAAPAQ